MLVQHFLRDSASRFPDKTVLVCGEQRVSYARFDALANALAHALLEGGLCPGDRVAICLPNCPEAAISVFGALKAGGVFVFLNPSIKEKKLRYVLNDCGPTALICARAQADLIGSNPRSYPTVKNVVVVGAGDGDFAARVEPGRPDPPSCRAGETDLASIIYTSGSTGEPKGVVCGHDNICFASASIMSYLENTPQDVLINVLPLSFDYGLYQLLMAVRFAGTLVLERSFTYPGELLNRIEAEKVTGLPLVPTLAALLLRLRWDPERLRTLRYITNTAAAMPVSHIRGLRRRMPWAALYSMYGLTECKRALYLPPSQIDERPGSVGIPIPGTQVWLEDESGRRLGPGGTGELIIQGRHVMRGYWQDPEATAGVFSGGPQPQTRTLRSGDLFRSDGEGYLYFLSRRDDVIKSRGEKVSPREVEEAAYSLDGILEAAAIGVPDGILGQKIKLFVVASDPTIGEQQIKRRCRERLEDYMVPHIVELRTCLPKTESGKIDRKSLA